ncbi:MAG: helix-turn-helix domain-containing protein [Elainellaceae cyanobacterium]
MNELHPSEIERQSLTWNGLELYRMSSPPPEDRVAYPPEPNHCITFHLTNDDNLERRLDGGKLLSGTSHPGNMSFVPAHQSPEWLWDTEVELLEIYLPPAALEQAAIATFEQSPQTVELIPRFAIRDPFIEQLALAFKQEVERGGPINGLYLESLQTVLAVHLLQSHCAIAPRKSNSSAGLSQTQLRQVIDYIQSRMDQEISLADLAKVAEISAYQFGKRFKQSTGLPPHRYVIEKRIERAQELLKQGDLAIVDVGQLVGFYDQSHFTHTFKRRTRFTPRQYRDRL